MAFLKNNKNIEGKWLVFDLGGGTFDAAILEMDDQVMAICDQGKATIGDNNLGGKLFDRAIFEKIILPHLETKYEFNDQLSDAEKKEIIFNKLKPEIESTKKILSDDKSVSFMPDFSLIDDNGDAIDLDLKISRAQFEKSIKEYVDRAIRLCKKLLKDSGISSDELISILLVGGPTLTPFIRESIKSKIADKIDVSIDPMTSVSTGAAYYASTRLIPDNKQIRDKTRLQLLIAAPSTVTKTEVKVGVKINDQNNDYSGYSIRFVRGDEDWDSGKELFDNGAVVVSVLVNENVNNEFLVEVYDDESNLCECEPSILSIMHGVKLSAPPLPSDLGISVFIKERKQEELISIIDKGTSLPARGKEKFAFHNDIRPGNASDVCEVQLWEGKKMTKSIRNNFMGTLIINGETVSSLIPKGSEMDITIKADESRRVEVEVYVPYSDEIFKETFDNTATQENISSDMLINNIDEEISRIADLDGDENLSNDNKRELSDMKKSLEEIKEKIDKQSNSEIINSELNNFKNKATEIDTIEGSMKWPETEKELNEAYSQAKNEVERNGDENQKNELANIKKEIKRIIANEDFAGANDILKLLTNLKMSIQSNSKEFWVQLLAYYYKTFDDNPWSDEAEARSILDGIGERLNDGDYTLDEVRNAYFNLINLLPEDKVQEVERIIRVPVR